MRLNLGLYSIVKYLLSNFSIQKLELNTIPSDCT